MGRTVQPANRRHTMNFDSMGKEALRAACKQAQVKGWGKMNNTQMREALASIKGNVKPSDVPAPAEVVDPAQLNTPELNEISKLSEPESDQLPQDNRVAPTAEFLDTLGVDGVKGHCPHCDTNLESNGYQTVEGIREVNPAAANKMQREYVCLGCNGEYGPKIVRTPAKPVANPTGIKIEKNREERNGVKRPSVGTICHHIWSELDRVRAASNGNTPSFKDLKALQDTHGWQRNTAVTQYQRWKEFNNLMVR